MVVWYALNDPNPTQELWRTATSDGQVYYGGNILTAGMNSHRGCATYAIAKLIFADKSRGGYFQEYLKQIVQDPSIAVRSCAAEALTAMLNYDRDLAVSLFLKLCDTEDLLLGTKTIEVFLYYAMHTHFHELESILERMIISDQPEVIKAGTRQACLISLHIQEAQWLTQLCLSATENHKVAAAEVFANNFHIAQIREFCENILIQLFNENSLQVRSEAARCFLHLNDNQINDHRRLIEEFIESSAFETELRNLIHILDKATVMNLYDIFYQVCYRFVEIINKINPEKKPTFQVNINAVSKLLIRAYSQTREGDIKLKCLDLIDQLLMIDVYDLYPILEAYER